MWKSRYRMYDRKNDEEKKEEKYEYA
jgi:hypothetical protein